MMVPTLDTTHKPKLPYSYLITSAQLLRYKILSSPLIGRVRASILLMIDRMMSL